MKKSFLQLFSLGICVLAGAITARAQSDHTLPAISETVTEHTRTAISTTNAPTPTPGCADAWTATSTTNAPSGRETHTTVWTGGEMIVWGGFDEGNYLNTGGRYNPDMKSWTETVTANAPAARSEHTAVWTGNEMIVWGGSDTGSVFNTGGRYNPDMKSWTATSTINAPAARSEHTAVWAGSEMIVWGGLDGGLNTGGRYNSSTDSWTAINTTNAPTARYLHTAVWTGSEMIVWGGNVDGSVVNTGGRYNPGTNSWTTTSTTNAPVRAAHTAVWTGSEMIIWGGFDGSSRLNTGARYNPDTDSWTATSTTDAPSGREGHIAIWTGSEMIVWGGVDDQFLFSNTGGRYDPAADSWTATSVTNAPRARTSHTAVWTGSEMIVWGGFDFATVVNSGGKYCAQLPTTPTPTPAATATPSPTPPLPTPTPTATSTVTPTTPTPTPACSANPVVTTNADSGPGSLRQAISDACSGGTITFDMTTVVSPITLFSALGTSRDLTINGPGADQLTISGNNNVAIFQAGGASSVVVTLFGLTLAHGASPSGGISNTRTGTLNLNETIVSNNVSSTLGGGLYNGGAGTINIRNSAIDNNSSPGQGGGILNANTGNITVTNCTISNNASFFVGSGGGISNSNGIVSVTNSTISGNSTSAIGGSSSGGGIFNGGPGTIYLTNNTITNNSATDGGGILNGSTGSIQITNCIVALNTAVNSGPDVSGTFDTLGHNFIGQNDGSTGFTPGIGNPNGDLVGTSASPLDPRLGPLANNGGPTLTQTLQSGSLAIDAGDNTAITNPPFSGPPFYDQRGMGFPRIVNTTVDIGSVEITLAPTPTPSPTPTTTPAPTSSPTLTPGATPTPTPSPAQTLNISTRMQVQTGSNVLIGGFIVTGNAPKDVAVRGIGPSLTQFGITDALADPTLELHAANGALITQDDDWQDDPTQAAQLTALHLAPSDPKESGIVATLQPASYTAILAGKDQTTGVGLLEIYDTNPGGNSQLANISTRGFVLTGSDVMIGGFILGGDSNTGVVVRGIGPSLAQFGLSPVLADPTLELHDSNGAVLVSNDNWQDDPTSASELTALGLAPSDPKESGIYRSLPPGAFTAVLAGTDDGTGIGLVEVYNVH